MSRNNPIIANSMIHSRRSVLKNTGLVALGATVAYPATGIAKGAGPLFPDGYPDRKQILQAAIDSAIAAGATYADARLSHKEDLYIAQYIPAKAENMAFGVRALYKGYWGFAASPVWTQDEGARMGAAAVAQAKANVLGRERITELAPLPEVVSGHWETPIEIDPFAIHSDEIDDYFAGLRNYMTTLDFMGSFFTSYFITRTSKSFASSEGQFTTQTIHSTGGKIAFSVTTKTKDKTAGGEVEDISPAGSGFEYFRNRPVRDFIQIAHEEALKDMELPYKPVDVGRFNILIDQWGVASLMDKSIGTATEIDRVFGFEANAGGTSYITEPESMLGTLKIGSNLLNISGDRSGVGSVGRVKWDDEGVAPTSRELIKDGILVNLQTNREGASWLKDYHQRNGIKTESSGVAGAPTALDVQLVQKADLYLEPGPSAAGRDELRESLGNGIEYRIAEVSIDFQQVTGLLRGRAYEIKNGKRVAKIIDAGVLFRTPELWSNLTAIGGKESVKYQGIESKKGQPAQTSLSGTYSPPATFKEMTIIDVKRKA